MKQDATGQYQSNKTQEKVKIYKARDNKFNYKNKTIQNSYQKNSLQIEKKLEQVANKLLGPEHEANFQIDADEWLTDQEKLDKFKVEQGIEI